MGPTDAGTNSIWPAAAALAGLWLLAWRLALTHAAVAAASRSRLRALAETGRRGSERLDALLGRRDAVQAALRLAFHVVLVLAAAAAWWLARQLELPDGAVAALTFVALAFGAELVPRLLASAQAEDTALRSLHWIETVYHVFGAPAGLALEAPSPRREEPDEDVAETFRELVDQAPLRDTQRRRITEILDFPDRTVGDIMVPRVDMVAVEADTSLQEVAATIVASGFSRLPVTGESREDVVGVAHARDVLAWLPRDGVAADLARSPLLVTETTRLDQLLRQMRAAKSSVAVVVDEFGGTAGLVTVEDVVEEIVGEIHDETDTAAMGIRARPEGGWLVPARTALEELGEVLGLELPDELEVNTVGGQVLLLSGDLPEPGEVVIWPLGPQRVLLQTLAVDGTRIVEVAALVQDHGEVEPAEIEWAPEGRLVEVPDELPLDRVAAALGIETAATGGAMARDLFAFVAATGQARREVRWHGWRACWLVADDGTNRVRFERAGGEPADAPHLV